MVVFSEPNGHQMSAESNPVITLLEALRADADSYFTEIRQIRSGGLACSGEPSEMEL